MNTVEIRWVLKGKFNAALMTLQQRQVIGAFGIVYCFDIERVCVSQECPYFPPPALLMLVSVPVKGINIHCGESLASVFS